VQAGKCHAGKETRISHEGEKVFRVTIGIGREKRFARLCNDKASEKRFLQMFI
jgi:hypothetical protein